ncbi:hypothetical protein NIES4071_00100 [Calothrix sp. NIES-4071]|nr:hypothetical protein NIES4071_00100 [Calothrix sp. NIES-4071]BAZ54357.1 hypothetical protein NIES4105_00100 [Calothrix sp. NIES-4105]
MISSRNLLNQEETQEFIQELAFSMNATSGDRINIQIGKNLIYTGIINTEPEMSKLTTVRALLTANCNNSIRSKLQYQTKNCTNT